MSAETTPAGMEAGFLRRITTACQQATGEPLAIWSIVALLSFASQIVLRRELLPGEFGTLNSLLGAIGLMLVPLVAVNFSFAHFPGQPGKAQPAELRGAMLLATETFTWIWAAITCLLTFVLMALLLSPRFSLQLFTLMNVLVGLGGLLSRAICTSENRLRLWSGLVIGAAITRLVASALFAQQEPWAEAGEGALIVGGFVTLAPAMRTRESDFNSRLAACRAACDREFLFYAGATLSVFLALFLYSSTDRIMAQRWFHTSTNANVSMVSWQVYDAYQTAGLLARGLLWAMIPLLWALYARRSQLDHTDARSRSLFWLYLFALVFGAIGLAVFARTFAGLFCGKDFQSTAIFIPTFAEVMVPLGLLQALGIFCLASRRFIECFTLGGSSVAYALALFFFGGQPQTMLSYMFGAAVVSLMIVLFVGVVRWGRKQP